MFGKKKADTNIKTTQATKDFSMVFLVTGRLTNGYRTAKMAALLWNEIASSRSMKNLPGFLSNKYLLANRQTQKARV